MRNVKHMVRSSRNTFNPAAAHSRAAAHSCAALSSECSSEHLWGRDPSRSQEQGEQVSFRVKGWFLLVNIPLSLKVNITRAHQGVFCRENVAGVFTFFCPFLTYENDCMWLETSRTDLSTIWSSIPCGQDLAVCFQVLGLLSSELEIATHTDLQMKQECFMGANQ